MAETDEQGTLGTSLLVFLLGVAVGATVAILYAPAAGSETRAQISEKAVHLKDRAADVGHQMVDKASQVRERVVSRANQAASEASNGGADGAGSESA